MADSGASACSCGGIKRKGTCNRCGLARGPDYRPTAAQRGYDGTWQRFRAWFLSEHPLCYDHEQKGQFTPATEVHHKLKVADYPKLTLEPSNCMALCKSCHSVRTARGE